MVTISEPEIANIETTPIEAVSNDSALKNQVDSWKIIDLTMDSDIEEVEHENEKRDNNMSLDLTIEKSSQMTNDSNDDVVMDEQSNLVIDEGILPDDG